MTGPQGWARLPAQSSPDGLAWGGTPWHRNDASPMALGALFALALIPALWPTGAVAKNEKIDERDTICAAYKGTALWGQCTRAVASGCDVSDAAHPRCTQWAEQWFDQTGVIAPWQSCDQPDLGGAACTVFVTSTTYTGDLGGIDGADAKCQALANEEHLGGTFFAWLSVLAPPATYPGTRFTRARVPYALLNGTHLAGDWNDLTDGALDALFDVTETGHELQLGEATHVATATTTNGDGGTIHGFFTPDCAGWTTASIQFGLHGTTTSTGTAWTDTSNPIPCSDPFRLYCFRQ